LPNPVGLLARSISTPLGDVVFHGPPEPVDAWGPVVVAVGDWEVAEALLAGLASDLPTSCTMHFVKLPSGAQPRRSAEVLSRALHKAFHGRRLVLAALGDASVAAALSYAPELLRTVVVDPPLTGESGQDLRTAYRTRRTPLDIVLAREDAWSAEDRAMFSREVHVEVSGPDPDDAGLDRVLRRAVDWVGEVRRAPLDMAARLAAAAPLTARRIGYAGSAIERFADACRRSNPDGEVGSEDSAVDTLAVLATEEDTPELAPLLATLAPGGKVVALAPLGEVGVRLQTALIGQGLQLVSPDAQLTPLGMRLIRAVKAAEVTVTRIDYVAYASHLMDVRTRLPTDGLRTELDLDLDLHAPPFMQVPGVPRILILQRAPSAPPAAWQTVAARAIHAGQVIVAEFDDHPDLTSLIRRDRHTTDDEWEQFRVAHAVQTSTEPLLPVFRAHNPEVRVFENCVFDLPPFPETKPSPRVFYGAIGRGPFAVEVAKALGPTIEAFPSVEFHVVGDREVFEALPTARKQFDPLLPYARYLAAMADCSISMSPIAAGAMVETKSDAKYLDAARSGVLTIGSSVLYGRVIQHGENGLLAGSVDEWPGLLALALGDEAARQRMARAAWEHVRRNRMFSQQAGARRDWYRDLLLRREALNWAILERSPGVREALAKLTATD
jgi:hypothetical protein